VTVSDKMIALYFAIKLETLRCQEHSVDIVHTLGRIGIRLSAETRNCLRNLQITFVTHPVSYSEFTGDYFSGKSAWGMELISDLLLEPCLRTHRAVPPLSHTPSCRGA
jgi:hypothetical protein